MSNTTDQTINQAIWNISDERAKEIHVTLVDDFNGYVGDDTIDEDERNWAGFFKAKLENKYPDRNEQDFAIFSFAQVYTKKTWNPLEELLGEMTGE